MTICYEVRYTDRCNRGHISEAIPLGLLAIAALAAFYAGRTVRNSSLFNCTKVYIKFLYAAYIILALSCRSIYIQNSKKYIIIGEPWFQD
jgi:hypothetical protein